MSDYGSTVESCVVLEYVIVVGSEDLYMKSSPGNWMMFMAQAVRYVRVYGGYFDLTTVFYFQGKGHTVGQVTAFTNSVKTYGGDPKPAKTWSDVATHINSGTATKAGMTCQKKVQVVIFIAHGTPGKGIWLSNQEGIYFTAVEAAQVNASAFVDKNNKKGWRWRSRHATSLACQTGNAGQPIPPWTVEQNMSGSLAQATSNAWDIDFYASANRTLYTNTWGNRVGGWLSGRREIDGAVWEDDGADGSVTSSQKGAQTDAKMGAMPSGFFMFQPGQTSGYKSYWIS
ncbi:hypothetical protein [Polyangium sp. 15x6]|uniref:hypothetical protein n=1 Tax=Polyangium sp. 15x6 TaxID=3042687 RepID=UPI00249C7EB7|nr:hypothetical protein [Polyangium sp. 15x6]MDI3290299.1 hypothetical protein [Polyangium sp. 15x6]